VPRGIDCRIQRRLLELGAPAAGLRPSIVFISGLFTSHARDPGEHEKIVQSHPTLVSIIVEKQQYWAVRDYLSPVRYSSPHAPLITV
jgi:hypothetical protein